MKIIIFKGIKDSKKKTKKHKHTLKVFRGYKNSSGTCFIILFIIDALYICF